MDAIPQPTTTAPDAAAGVARKSGAVKPRFWYSAGGSLMCDRHVAGVTRDLPTLNDSVRFYGFGWFVAESMSICTAETIALALGGEWFGAGEKIKFDTGLRRGNLFAVMNTILILTAKRMKAQRDADDKVLARARAFNTNEATPKKSNRTPNASRK